MTAALPARTMTNTPSALEVVTLDQLTGVTGGGIGTQIGSLFGPKGQQWGSIADNILGGLGGGGAPQTSGGGGGQ
jgi:hypothetical protein